MLCDDLEGWDREGQREAQEGGDMVVYAYIQLIHFVVQQKLTQHCKAMILQKRCIKKKKLKPKKHYFLSWQSKIRGNFTCSPSWG